MIEIAARMFHERGYDATTLQDIADEVGLLKGSLYHYIDSKDDLLWAVVTRQHEAALARADRCRHLDAPPDARLAEFIRAHVESLESDRVFVAVYLHDVHRLSPERRERIAAERQTYTKVVVDLLAEGRRTGLFRKDLDPTLTSQAILGLLNATYRWYTPGTGPSAARIVDECLALIMRGIARPA